MLRLLAFPFWNAEERRLRAGLRIVLGAHLIFLIAFSPFALLSLYRRVVPSPAPTWIGDIRAIVDTNFFQATEHNFEATFTHASTAMVHVLLVLTAMWLVARFIDRRAFDHFGLMVNRGFAIDLTFGFVLGALLMLGILVAERTFGWAHYHDADEIGDVPRFAYAGVMLFSFFAVAIFEELFFRGFLVKNLAEGASSRFIPPWLSLTAACLISAAIFGLAHSPNPNSGAVAVGNIAMAGVWFAVAYSITEQLAIPIGVHFSWNFFQNLFGMPVSGQDRFFVGALISRDVTGPEWITGGAFGPEAGATGLVAMVVGAILTLAYVRMRYGTLRLHPSIATFHRNR